MAESFHTPEKTAKSQSTSKSGEVRNSSSVKTPPSPPADYLSAGRSSPGAGLINENGSTTPGAYMHSPGLSRTNSQLNFDEYEDETFPPLDKLTIFDVLENLAIPQQLERIHERMRVQQQRLQRTSKNAKDKVVEEWRKRLPTSDEQLIKYSKRMRESVERMTQKWKDGRYVTVSEKMSFIGGVLNIFISGYIIGAWPEYFYYWYTLQLCYFLPVRWFTYHKIGYHYFLADLCYFVNLLLILSIWMFPNSKRLFISTFCLAFGNNAIAIAMWRNSLVFHSLDKVTSLFIHIMPCVTLHCIVHLLPQAVQKERFPALYAIKYSTPGTPEHYSLLSMFIWSTVPYLAWQISYHFLITVRRREKIAAGRPTSYTWIRKSYAKTWIGKLVLSLPGVFQEPAFMAIQYLYALLTMIPCSIWFWSRWASAGFLLSVFTWATYNGATYYIDVFGRSMEKELEHLKMEVRMLQDSTGGSSTHYHSAPSPSAKSETRQRADTNATDGESIKDNSEHRISQDDAGPRSVDYVKEEVPHHEDAAAAIMTSGRGDESGEVRKR